MLVTGALAALALLLAWVGLDRPPGLDCGESDPPGHAKAVDDYQAVAIPIWIAVFLAAAVAARLRGMLARREQARLSRRVKLRIAAVALVLVALGVLAGGVDDVLVVVAFSPAIVGALPAVAIGTEPAAVLAALLLLAAGILAARALSKDRPERRALRLSSVLPWLVLFLTPGQIWLITLVGRGPLFC